MNDFLINLRDILKLEKNDKLSEEELKKKVINQIKKILLIEDSLFKLSENFSCNVELSLKIMSLFVRIIDKIYCETDPYKFIEYCLDEIIKVIPAENISYMEKHPDFDCLILKVATGKIKLDKFKEKIFKIESTVAGETFKTNSPIYIPDVLIDKRFDLNLSDLPIRSLLCVPLKVKDELIGVMNFSHPYVNSFDDYSVFFLTSMANIFSTVFTNFKLYSEIRNFNENLKKEIKEKTYELKKINRTLYRESITDALTGLSNRRFFFQRLDEEFSKFLRYGNSFCLIIFDLDNLKNINDTFGHTEGDRLIKTFGRVLRKNKRKEDIVSRIGGDEFACIIFANTTDNAKKFAERVRLDFGTTYKKTKVSVTGAIGYVGRGSLFKPYKNHKELYKEVDQALLKAKKTRNIILAIETN